MKFKVGYYYKLKKEEIGRLDWRRDILNILSNWIKCKEIIDSDTFRFENIHFDFYSWEYHYFEESKYPFDNFKKSEEILSN